MATLWSSRNGRQAQMRASEDFDEDMGELGLSGDCAPKKASLRNSLPEAVVFLEDLRALDGDRLHDHILLRAVLRSARYIRNLIHDVLPLDDLAEDRVLTR